MARRTPRLASAHVGKPTPSAAGSGARFSIDPRLLGVVIRFLVYFAIGYALFAVLESRGMLWPIDNLVANASAWFIQLTGVPVDVINGNQCVVPNKILIVDGDCSAIPLIIMYVSLVLAYPASWSTRVKGLLVGILAISAANLLRLVLLGNISASAPQSFDMWHVNVLPILLDFVLVGAWLGWLMYARSHAR